MNELQQQIDTLKISAASLACAITVLQMAQSSASVQLKFLDERLKDAPEYKTPGSAAVDLAACLPEGQDKVIVYPNESVMIGTGIAVYIGDPAFAGVILPRSGLGAKNGIILGNGTGLIDSDYQGELKISIWNRKEEPFVIQHGDRIAQYMVIPVKQVKFATVDEFNVTSERGKGGFGHTGVSA